MSDDIIGVNYQGLNHLVYLSRNADGKYHCSCGRNYKRARDIRNHCEEHEWDGKSGFLLVPKNIPPQEKKMPEQQVETSVMPGTPGSNPAHFDGELHTPALSARGSILDSLRSNESPCLHRENSGVRIPKANHPSPLAHGPLAMSPSACNLPPSPKAVSHSPRNDSRISHASPAKITTSELECPAPLQSCGFVINRQGNFLVCTICRRAVLGSIAAKHAANHGLTFLKKANMNKVIEGYGVIHNDKQLKTFKETVSNKTPLAYEGIDLSTGFKCVHCGYVSVTYEATRVHISRLHSSLPDRAKPKAIKIQDLYFNPNDKLIIEVRERLSSNDATDLMVAWEDHISDIEDEDPPMPATRELPPWLKTLGWLKHLEGMDPNVVCAFLATVRKSKLCKSVTKAVIGYLSAAMEYLGSLLLQVRQVLKSVTTDIENHFFKEPEHEETIPRYASFLGIIITAYYQSANTNPPSLPSLLSQAQSTALRTLCETITTADQHDLLMNTHNALKNLLVYRYSAAQINVKRDPIFMFTLWANWHRDGSFNIPNTITGSFAKLAFVAKCIVLMDLWLVMEPVINEEQDGVLSSEDPVDYDNFLQQRRSLIVQGSWTPMGTVYAQWWTLLRAARDECNIPTFMFTDNAETCFTFKGIMGNIDDLRKLIHTSVEECQRTLKVDLFFGLDDPSLHHDSSKILDNPSIVKVGYSFLTEPKNDLVDRHKTLLRQLFESSNTEHQQYFGHYVGSKFIWNTLHCERYLQKAQHFLKHLLMAMHLTHGQPTRGSEMLATTFQNLPHYPRSLMCVDGWLVNALAVNKTESITGHRKLSPHWPTRQISELLISYLVYIRPIELRIAHIILPPDIAKQYKAYLFTGPHGRWDRNLFTNFLLEATRAHLGPNSGLGLADMRQVLIGIYRQKCNSPFKDTEAKSAEEEFMEAVGDLQANHSSRVARAYYAIQPHEMGSIPSITFRACKKYSMGVHALWGLLDTADPSNSLFDYPSNVSKLLADASSPDVDMTAVKHVLDGFMKSVQASLVEIKNSVQSTVRDGFAEAGTAIIEGTRQPPASSSLVPSLATYPSSALLRILHSFDPSLRHFRSNEQALALNELVNKKNNNLIVLPTGEGKTLCWMAAVKTQHSHLTTVIVLPYISLHMDCQRRCAKFQLPFETWSRSHPQPTSPVVFVNTTDALTPEFATFIYFLLARKQISQIVIDEAHVLLTEREFRQHLPRLKLLFGFGVPVQMLTATLPSHLVEELKTTLNVTHLKVIRRHNGFKNTKIAMIVASTPEERLRVVCQSVRDQLSELERVDGRGLVICQSVQDSLEVAVKLDTRAYYGDLPEQDKRRVFEAWVTGTSRVLVSTTACGTGIDLPNVLFVIHNGIPFDTITYVQNIGRVGRDGRVGSALLVTDERDRIRAAAIPDGDPFGVQNLVDLAFSTDVCRKLRLTAFMDGSAGLQSCLGGGHLCDICAKAAGQAFTWGLKESSRITSLSSINEATRSPCKRSAVGLESYERNVRPRLSLGERMLEPTSEDPFWIESEGTPNVGPNTSHISTSKSMAHITRPFSTLAITPSSPTIAIKIQQLHTQMVNASEQDIRQGILTVLTQIQGLCIPCFFMANVPARDHKVFKCRTAFKHAGAFGKLVEVMPKMHLPFDQVQRMCYSCYLPTDSFPNYAHAEGSRQADACYFRHILKPFIWTSWAHPELRDLVIRHFKPVRKGKAALKETDWQAYYEWCFERGPKKSSLPNLVFVFKFLYDIVSEKIKELP